MGMGDIATSGMQAAMSNMEVISNNISNVNTLGFKKSTATFSDLFPSGGNAAGVQIGLGVSLSGVQQNFKPGTPTATNIQSDLAITGDGFFIMKDSSSGLTTYSRNGHFAFDNVSGYFELNGQRLQAYAATNNVIPSGITPTDLKINTAVQPAKATSVVTAQGLNLNSGDSAIALPFDKSNVATYNFTNKTVMYDSLGNQTMLDLYYVKTAANSWNVYAAIGNTMLAGGSPATMTFDSSGALTGSTGFTGFTYSPTTGAANMTFDIAMAGTTQYGTADRTAPFTTDGYAAAKFNTYQIDSNGLVKAIYSTGEPVTVGRIALATFQSPQNLQNLGGASWAETTQSGAAIVNPENSTDSIRQGALETSNADLAEELVRLISAQNSFQANAQVENVYNQVMQTVTKMG